MRPAASLVLLALLLGPVLSAEPVPADKAIEDVVRLARAELSEDVLLAWAEQQTLPRLSVDAILKLKEAGVPDRVIAVLVRGGGRDRAHRRHVESRVAVAPGVQGYVVQPSAAEPQELMRYSVPPVRTQAMPYLAPSSLPVSSADWVQPAVVTPSPSYVYTTALPYDVPYRVVYCSSYPYYPPCYGSWGFRLSWGHRYWGHPGGWRHGGRVSLGAHGRR